MTGRRVSTRVTWRNPMQLGPEAWERWCESRSDAVGLLTAAISACSRIGIRVRADVTFPAYVPASEPKRRGMRR